MKRIVKQKGFLFLLILGLVLMADLAGAQEHQPRPPKMLPDSSQIVKMINDLPQKLDLSADQKEEVLSLHLAHFKEAKEMMEKGKKEHEKHRSEMEALKNDFENQLVSLFNDDQKALFEKFMQERGHGKKRPRSKH